MSKDVLVRCYLQALHVELKQGQEYVNTGKWHVDCTCYDCRCLEKWLNLSWWTRLRAKLAF